jgi:hypothetical protein
MRAKSTRIGMDFAPRASGVVSFPALRLVKLMDGHIRRSSLIADPAELRARARLCRLAASTPTTGGADADRVLLALAERLDREAVVLEEIDAVATARRSQASETDR